jgi:hypothetical protein
MDQFKPRAPKARSGKNDQLWNMLSGVMLLLTLCMGGYFLSLFINPQSKLNLFPPATLIPTLPPASPTPIGLPPTWTPTPTVAPTETPTPRPTITLEPSSTTFVLPSATPRVSPTNTPKGSATPKATGAAYVATVTANDSVLFNPSASCNWAGVAGQVIDKKNAPKIGFQVRLGGFWNNQSVELTSLSGVSPQYGQSGFEFVLGDTPLATTKLLWIQLFDQSGSALSEQVYFDTYAECQKNLIVVRFKEK